MSNELVLDGAPKREDVTFRRENKRQTEPSGSQVTAGTCPQKALALEVTGGGLCHRFQEALREVKRKGV
jgi:hypothetical protein